MNRSKYLVTNTAILFISNFASKMLVFFLLPLYTSVLSTEEYGISDLITTTVHLLYIFLTLQIAHGIIRYTMDKSTAPGEMLGMGLGFTIVSSAVVAAGSGLAYALDAIPLMNPYYGYLVLIYVFNCLGQVFTAFAKGREKIRLIGIAGIVSTAVRVLLNILLLVLIPLGIRGYLLAAVLSHVAMCLVFVAGGTLAGTRLAIPKNTNFLKTLKYSAPIAATEVGWLICISSDRYIVSWLLGASATGIISAAHRLPTILTAFTTVFIQAWTLSAIKESDKADKARYYSRMFNYYNAFVVVVGAALILAAKLIGSFLFRGDFAIAWIYTPIYLVALVINTISSFSGSIISAGTDTRPLFTSTGTGAVVNIVLDILLIKWLGLFGAGIATVLSYVVIGALRLRTVRKTFDVRIDNWRMLGSETLLCGLAAVVILGGGIVSQIVSIVLAGLIVAINGSRLVDIAKMLFQTVARRKRHA